MSRVKTKLNTRNRLNEGGGVSLRHHDCVAIGRSVAHHLALRHTPARVIMRTLCIEFQEKRVERGMTQGGGRIMHAIECKSSCMFTPRPVADDQQHAIIVGFRDDHPRSKNALTTHEL